MFTISVIIGLNTAINLIDAIDLQVRSSLTFSNLSSSKSKRLKALTTLTPLKYSLITPFTLSIDLWTLRKYGYPYLKFKYINPPTIGTIVNTINAILRSNLIDIIMHPIASKGALTNILINPYIKFCILVISFVSLVINEPLSNLSILSKSKLCILLNTSNLRSAPKSWATVVANLFLLIAMKAPKILTPIIINPYFKTILISFVEIPLSIIIDINVGWSKSHKTSSITHPTAKKNIL